MELPSQRNLTRRLTCPCHETGAPCLPFIVKFKMIHLNPNFSQLNTIQGKQTSVYSFFFFYSKPHGQFQILPFSCSWYPKECSYPAYHFSTNGASKHQVCETRRSKTRSRSGQLQAWQHDSWWNAANREDAIRFVGQLSPSCVAMCQLHSILFHQSLRAHLAITHQYACLNVGRWQLEESAAAISSKSP